MKLTYFRNRKKLDERVAELEDQVYWLTRTIRASASLLSAADDRDGTKHRAMMERFHANGEAVAQ